MLLLDCWIFQEEELGNYCLTRLLMVRFSHSVCFLLLNYTTHKDLQLSSQILLRSLLPTSQNMLLNSPKNHLILRGSTFITISWRSTVAFDVIRISNILQTGVNLLKPSLKLTHRVISFFIPTTIIVY